MPIDNERIEKFQSNGKEYFLLFNNYAICELEKLFDGQSIQTILEFYFKPESFGALNIRKFFMAALSEWASENASERLPLTEKGVSGIIDGIGNLVDAQALLTKAVYKAFGIEPGTEEKKTEEAKTGTK